MYFIGLITFIVILSRVLKSRRDLTSDLQTSENLEDTILDTSLESDTVVQRPTNPINYAEKYVSAKLWSLDPSKYIVLDDLLLPNRNTNRTSQIDHVVISHAGIYCIETKGHRGWIFGSLEREQWTQSFYHSKYPVPNPIWQNQRHLMALKNVLDGFYEWIPMFSLVVFPNAGQIRIWGCDEVGSIDDILGMIESNTSNSLDEEDMNLVHRILKTANITDLRERKLHIERVQSYLATKAARLAGETA